MTIKEVEELTGLTAKAIRHYEKEGLICIKRNQMNSYRNYLEKDVETLRKIKLFRYLEFSIEEIKIILKKENNEISEEILNKAKQLQEKNEDIEKKKDLCFKLSKDVKKDGLQTEKYQDIIELNEDEEIQEALKEVKIWSVFASFIWFVPIISLFINIVTQRYDVLIKNAIAAIIATIILTLNFRDYIYWCKYEKKIVKEKIKKNISLIPILIVVPIFFCFLVIALSSIIEHFMAPEDWLFYEFQSSELLVIILICCPILYFLNLIEKKKNNESIILKQHINTKIFIPLCIVWVIGMYICFTNVTFVTENSIMCFSPVNLVGKEYRYNEISKVEAKFNKKGDFEYTIKIEEKQIIFKSTSSNSEIERYEDSYLELEEFDAKLMDLNITKESNESNSEKCNLDQVYVDRFLRIIRNK